MKIICIGRNYAAHAKEMNAPAEPVFFMKPDTAILQDRDFYIPEFTHNLHYETELILKICKAGKHVEEKFAHKYFSEVGLGIDFTARDLQEECKKKGLPWEMAKSFDNSAVIGKFIAKEKLDMGKVGFELKVNGEKRQESDSSKMIFSFEKMIAYVSRFVTLRTGDILFTGSPEGVGPVKPGDLLEGFLNGESAFKVNIK
jgi:acylpyruvate hydrolase